MRTPEEIKEWLENGYFYKNYKINLLSNGEGKDEQDKFANGLLGDKTIKGAFTWYTSPEGQSYWEEVNDMFTTWYNQEEQEKQDESEKQEQQESSDNQETHGRKNDIIDDKLRWDLLPLQDIEEFVKVFHSGAKKYGDNNWQNLDNGYERYKAALFRHLLEVEEGNEIDEDTGCFHIAQVAWNAIAMLHIKLNEYRNKNEKNKC